MCKDREKLEKRIEELMELAFEAAMRDLIPIPPGRYTKWGDLSPSAPRLCCNNSPLIICA